MITIEPEPMYGPPSWRCQIGAGNLARSTSAPVMRVLEEGGVLHGHGLAAACSVLRFSIQALSASSGRSAGSSPSASAARCGLVTALVKTRKPRGKPLMSSNSSAGQSGMSGGDLGDAADLEPRIGALDRPQRAELVDKLDELAQILVHPRPAPPSISGGTAP